MPRRGEIVTTGECRKPPPPEGAILDSWGRELKGYAWETATWTDPETGETEERQRLVPPDERRCTKMVISRMNGWRGNRCAALRIKGHWVCLAHGGRLGSVKKAAQRRLAMAAMPALEGLIEIALHKPGVEDGDRIRALCQILDRAGVTGKTEITLELKPWQALLQRVAGQLPAGEGEAVLDGEFEEELNDEYARTAPSATQTRSNKASKRQPRGRR